MIYSVEHSMQLGSLEDKLERLRSEWLRAGPEERIEIEKSGIETKNKIAALIKDYYSKIG